MRVSGGWECSLLRAAVILGSICAAICLFRKLGRLLRERRLLRDWKHRLEAKAAHRRAMAAEKAYEKNDCGKNPAKDAGCGCAE